MSTISSLIAGVVTTDVVESVLRSLINKGLSKDTMKAVVTSEEFEDVVATLDELCGIAHAFEDGEMSEEDYDLVVNALKNIAERWTTTNKEVAS